ncbi:MAG: ketoacyl-ACP synthase III [Clostridiales bacterium]|nr:ketoacyl-ACP synthase III [Clostridiales bacterium]
MYFTKIMYTGSFVPEKIVTNDDLAQIVDTNDEWIVSRTGVGQRRISQGDNTSDLAAKAAKKILEKGNLNPEEIDLLIVATVSADYMTPSTACLVQAKIGAKNAIAFDVTAACSGFIYGLSIADKFIQSGVYKNAIVIGAEVLSKHVDWTDRTTCVLFGDGAGGAYVERAQQRTGILAENIGSDGTKGLALTGDYVAPANVFNDISKAEDVSIRMDGKAIFDFATRTVPKSIHALMEKAGVGASEIKYVIPHQANERIVQIISRKTGIPMEKFYLNMFYYGNTSAASIPIAFDEMNQKGMLAPGDKILLTGFGGGLTWGSMLIEL